MAEIPHLFASALAPMWRDSCNWWASLSVHNPFAAASALSLPNWKNPLIGLWLLMWMTDIVPFREKSASSSIRAVVDVDTPGPDMAKQSLATNIESVTMLRCMSGTVRTPTQQLSLPAVGLRSEIQRKKKTAPCPPHAEVSRKSSL